MCIVTCDSSSAEDLIRVSEDCIKESTMPARLELVVDNVSGIGSQRKCVSVGLTNDGRLGRAVGDRKIGFGQRAVNSREGP